MFDYNAGSPPGPFAFKPTRPFMADLIGWSGAFVAAVLLVLALLTAAHAESGKASFYTEGARTASGQRYNKNAMTCAHRSHPFGTRLRVQWGTRSVVCVVNDRGPFVRGRVVDLSLGSARALGMVGAGVVPVSLSVE
jgi:rare lipoprotein A